METSRSERSAGFQPALRTQNRKSKIQNWLALLLAAGIASCVGSSPEFTPEQQAVFDVMQAWARAVEQRDTDALWNMLSRDGQRYYGAELDGARNAVKMTKAALEPDSLVSQQRRKELEEYLKTLPPDPDAMETKDYYTWRLKNELTPERIANQTRLYARANVERIEIDVDRATVTLVHGDPKSYSLRKESGDWKFDVIPSMLRNQEAGRKASK
jgi:hypothetical protein